MRLAPGRTDRRQATLAVAFLAVTVAVEGHPLSPSLLSVELEADGSGRVEWRVPHAVAALTSLTPRLPASCSALAEPELITDDTFRIVRWQARCGVPLPGDAISVLGLAEVAGHGLENEVLVRFRSADGRLARTVLSARRPEFEIPVRATQAMVFRDYFRLGVAHLLGGLDHLVFLLGLLLLVLRSGTELSLWRLTWTVTAFTAGHAISLSSATLGIVQVPASPVEIAIALSIVWLAAELAAEPEPENRLLCRPWRLAVIFGLLHGFGFAGALAEVGLPADEVPAALFAFNCGLEAGQLAVVLLAIVLFERLARSLPSQWPRLIRSAGWTAGIAASYWTFKRGSMLL